MSTESPRILIVDDDPDIVQAARLLLGRHGMTTIPAGDPHAAWVALAQGPVDAILLDLNFARGHTSGDEGFAMLDRLIAADAHAAVVVVTGHSGVAAAVRAMKAGASDFVVKPWSNPRLLATVERAVALRRARVEVAGAVPVAEDQLLGESNEIVRARAVIARVAPTAAPVLVRGNVGTGKSLATRLIHAASGGGALVTVDGATAQTIDGNGDGAVLIEDVDAVPRAEQRDLVQRLSGRRVIVTSRLPRAALREALTDDLLYRVNTIELDLPPLETRGGDTLLLARFFLDLFAARHGRAPLPLSDEAARALAADRWPDNVRGLRQACERAVLLGVGPAHEIADFALAIDGDAPMPRAGAVDLHLGRGEKALVAAALQRHAFNVSRAAAELGLTRAALYRRMEKHGL